MKKIMRMFTENDENYELQMFIAKVNRNDELKAAAYTNRRKYVNPRALFLGSNVKKEEVFFYTSLKDCCPV